MRGKRKPSVNAGESEMAGEGRRDWQLGEIKTDKQEGKGREGGGEGRRKGGGEKKAEGERGRRRTRGGGWGNSKTEIGSGEEGEAAG